MKILVVGYMRHGKDTVCEMLRDNHGLKFESSSELAVEKIHFDIMAPKYGYKTFQECYDDRVNHRQEWFEQFREYSKDDPSKWCRQVFQVSDMYCGLRNKTEFHSLKNRRLFDACIWVDRSDHLPPEPKESMTIEQWMADYTIDNNGTLEQLEFRVDEWYKAQAWKW
jgi:hypothetical protein